MFHSGFNTEALSKNDSIYSLIALLRGKSHPTYAYNKLREGDIHMKMDSIHRSIKCYLKALKIFENTDIFLIGRSDNLPYEEKCHVNLSNAYSQVRNDSLALYHNNMADSIHSLCKIDAIESYANILLQKGCIYRDMEDYEQMLHYYQKCFDFLCSSEKDVNDYEAAEILNIITEYLLFLNRFEIAKIFSNQELIFAEKSGEWSALSTALDDKLRVSINLNNLEETDYCINRMREALGDCCYEYSEYWESICHYLSYLLDIKDFEKIWQIIPELDKFCFEEISVEFATRISLLSQIYFHYGDIAKAINIFKEEAERRLRIFGENSTMYATALNNLSIYYEEIGDFDKAISYGEQAYKIRNLILEEYDEQLHHSLNNLSELYCNVREFNKSISLCKELLRISLNPSNGASKYVGEIMGRLGYYYLCADSTSMAYEYISNSVKYIENEFNMNSLMYARALSTLADYYYQIDDLQSAFNTEYACLEIFKDLVGEDNPYYLSKLSNIVNYAYMTDRLSMFNTTLEQYNTYLINYSLQNLSCLNFRDKENFWKIQKDWFLDRLPFFSSMDTKNSKLASYTYNGLLFGKSLLLNMKKNTNVHYSWEDVKKSLSDGELAIEFGKYQYRDTIYYIAALVDRTCSSPMIVNLFNDQELQKVGLEKQYISSKLTEIIWKPLDKIISQYNHIYFSSIGILHSIAIESLPDYLGEGRISDRFKFYRLTSTRELIQSKNSINSSSAALFGNIDYSSNSAHIDSNNSDLFGIKRGTMAKLPGTKREIENIQTTLTKAKYAVSLYAAHTATETAFKNLSQSSPKFIHVATHGFYWSNMDNLDNSQRYLIYKYSEHSISNEERALCKSGLMFAGANKVLSGKEKDISPLDDGILTAKEISNLNLQNVDLIALSACQTGLGEVSDEGVFGLQRGFKIAGVNSILMSLWEVDDDATCLLMSEFYNNLLIGSSKQESLNIAQKKVQEILGFEDPEYWAGWILLDALN